MSTTLRATHTRDHHLSKIGLTDGSVSQHPSTTPIIIRARPNTDTPYSQSSCAHGLVTERSPPSVPFNSGSSSSDNRTKPLSTEQYNSWETPSSRERCYSSDTLPKNSRRHDKKLSKHAPKFNTHNKSRCWQLAPSPLPVKPRTPQSNALNKPGPTASSTRFYFAKPFGMLATTRTWSTYETTSTVSYRREDDRHHQPHRARVLHLPTSLTSWHGSTTHLCATCTQNPSFKMVEMMTSTVSEVAVFTP